MRSQHRSSAINCRRRSTKRRWRARRWSSRTLTFPRTCFLASSSRASSLPWLMAVCTWSASGPLGSPHSTTRLSPSWPAGFPGLARTPHRSSCTSATAPSPVTDSTTWRAPWKRMMPFPRLTRSPPRVDSCRCTCAWRTTTSRTRPSRRLWTMASSCRCGGRTVFATPSSTSAGFWCGTMARSSRKGAHHPPPRTRRRRSRCMTRVVSGRRAGARPGQCPPAGRKLHSGDRGLPAASGIVEAETGTVSGSGTAARVAARLAERSRNHPGRRSLRRGRRRGKATGGGWRSSGRHR
mmetsp:Transcript_15580/g.49268  ORF Transcript_15580/g.49268 Transcript_15580/m.49268 type:complete len:294 (-) Transcript_15580:491-1372(-)